MSVMDNLQIGAGTAELFQEEQVKKRVVTYSLNYGQMSSEDVYNQLSFLRIVSLSHYGVPPMWEFKETTTDHKQQWQLFEIINLAKRREIDVLVVWDLETLSCRVPMHTLDLLHTFIKNGVEVYLANEHRAIGRDCGDTLVYPLLDWIMNFGKRRLSLMSHKVHRAIRSKGTRAGRKLIPINVDEAIMRHNRKHETYTAIARSLGISRVMLWQRVKAREIEKKLEREERKAS